ncbi:hypothetical protein Pfo_023747 [Paulownia fortunei]|nr:hypothetical protein Pfo_023747 [Paulownia fortunei]
MYVGLNPTKRPEGNPLDLNNLPEDYTRDGKQVSEDSSSSAVAGGYRKKKSGAKEGKDEPGKVYECRFCSLKFCKSQALGGHMNRHRQGKLFSFHLHILLTHKIKKLHFSSLQIKMETETLNKARQLVFTNDLAPGHLGYVSGGQPIPQGGYHQSGNMGDPALPFRSMYPTRLLSTSSPLIPPTPPPPPPQPQAAPYMYTSPPRLLSFHSQYPAPPPVNDYFVGHVLSNSSYGATPTEGNYTCIGAPVGHGFANSGGSGVGGGGVRDVSLHNQEEGLNWGRR